MKEREVEHERHVAKTVNKPYRRLKSKGKADYFGVYRPDTGKIYMIMVTGASKSSMHLRFKNAGVLKGNRNGVQCYDWDSQARSTVNYHWAEDYEM